MRLVRFGLECGDVPKIEEIEQTLKLFHCYIIQEDRVFVALPIPLVAFKRSSELGRVFLQEPAVNFE